MKEKIIFILVILAQTSFSYGEEDITFSDPAIDRKWRGEVEGSSHDSGEGREGCGSCGG